jgi:hypothetical protein
MNIDRSSVRMAAICALAAACPALAQNALDRNLQRGSGGVNPSRPDFAQEMQFRNAVVTGNAPGGMSFRGDVGYRAPGEFFGRLGSNETYSFRRDSVYSGLGGLGLRGTDALQYQFAMTTGNAPPPAYAGLPIMHRSGTATTGATLHELPYRTSTIGLAPGELDFGRGAPRAGGPDMLPLRSTSAYATSRGLQPTLLGTVLDDEGQRHGLTASTLRGISLSPLQSERQIETGVPERPEERREPGQTESRDRSPLEATLPQPRLGADQRVDSRLGTSVDPRRSPYDQVLDRMRGDGTTGRDATGMQLPERFDGDLQRRLAELRAEFSTTLRQGVTERSMRETEAAQPDEPVDPVTAPQDLGQGFDPATVDMLQRGGAVDTLAPEGFDAYSNAMRSGQQLLAAGRYFDAEARFTSALGARPGDPMAAAGRIHAELGAGMFLSAALNLRALLIQNPEMVGVKYAADLLPASNRIPPIKNRLREMLAEHQRQDPELGLLLAYLGYQTDDQPSLQEGLKVMGEAKGEQQDLRRLSELLRQVWTKPPAAETAPPPRPNPAPPPSK